MLYRNYIKVEPDFIPVFTSDSYRTHPDKWKSYYPHESFKKINNFGYTAVLVREKLLRRSLSNTFLKIILTK